VAELLELLADATSTSPRKKGASKPDTLIGNLCFISPPQRFALPSELLCVCVRVVLPPGFSG